MMGHPSMESTALHDFGEALRQMRAGRRVARQGWNGRGMYIYLVPGSEFRVNRPPLNELLEPGTLVTYRSHIDMCTAQGDFVPWTASQTDVLAGDWYAF